MKTLAIALITVALPLVGCMPDNTLSRQEAAEIIQHSSLYPAETTIELYMNGRVTFESPGVAEFMNNLNRLGLATASSTESGRGMRTYTDLSIQLTDKGKRYLRGKETPTQYGHTTGNFAVQTCKFEEVTGIAYLNDDKTNALVEYTQSCSFTPVAYAVHYDMVRYASGSAEQLRKKLEKNAGTKQVRLQLYDDGWRIAS